MFGVASVYALSNLLVCRRRGHEEEEQLCELVMYSGKIRFVLLETASLLTKKLVFLQSQLCVKVHIQLFWFSLHITCIWLAFWLLYSGVWKLGGCLNRRFLGAS